MGHGKETPRQKMIGMMYLVLTALLALNVQKEVLDAFTNVDHGINKIMHNFIERNDHVYAEFAEKATINPEKVGPSFEKAKVVQEMADKIHEQIQEYKLKIVKTSEGEDTEAVKDNQIDLTLVGGTDNMSVPAQIMVTEKRGTELKKSIEDFREHLVELAEGFPKVIESIETSLNTDDHKLPDGTPHSWESINFEHLPLAGVIAIMSGIQTDVRNAESEILNHLYNQIDAGSFKFNKLEPVVIPNTNYVIRGNTYEAEVFLAAFDTTQKPKIYVGNYEIYEEEGVTKYRMVGSYDSLEISEGGRGIYRRPGTSVNSYKWGGIIKLQKADGSYIVKEFQEEYQVAEGSVVVSPTKMNVFYQGVENPVEISVSGVPANKIQPRISNATINSRPPYMVSPRRLGNSVITVMAEIDGEWKEVGSKMFRVKRIPDPIAKVGGRKGGAIAKNVLIVQTGVQADLENFDFDLSFRVIEFTVSATVRGFFRQFQSKGNNFTQEQKDLIQSLNRGDKVYIEEIKAIGPDGVPRDLPTVSFLIQ